MTEAFVANSFAAKASSAPPPMKQPMTPGDPSSMSLPRVSLVIPTLNEAKNLSFFCPGCRPGFMK